MIRNALRYQLSNLYDFDPATNAVPDDQLTGLDRWILDEFCRLEHDAIKAYDEYEFHVVYQRLSQFVAVELSAIYHDLVKDRLYTDGANSKRRRSTQTALHRMVASLCKMLAPLLAFTADEAWEHVPGRTADSAHSLAWQPMEFSRPEPERELWRTLFQLRELALTELEKARQAKQIGKALDARLTITGSGAAVEQAKANPEVLRELLNVSQLEINSAAQGEIVVSVSKAAGQKCERCWHWETDVGSNPAHPAICGRCVEAVSANLSKVG